jgi:hypothetical protein
MRVGELVDEARLAHPRLTDDSHHLATTGAGELLDAAKVLQLGIPPDKSGQAATGGCLQARTRRTCSRHLVDLDGVGEPLYWHGAERLHGNVTFHQLQGPRRQENGTWARQLLHSRCEVRGLSDGGVVRAQVVADGAHDHLARIESNSDLSIHAMRSAHVIGVAIDRILHLQGRITSAHRVVLMGERRTKESHDAVAHHLVDGALVAMNCVHHQLQHRIKELSRLFGVAVGKQLHRALQIGEQDCHLFALTFKRALGR